MSEEGSIAKLHTAMDGSTESGGRFRRVFRGMGPRRASLPILPIAPSRSLNLLKKQLLKDNSTGSLMSIYDDQSMSSSEELSDYSPDPTGSVPIVSSSEYGYLGQYPWYTGKLSRLGSEQYLEGMRNGTYLVRESDARSSYTHAIAIRWKNKPFHIRIYNKEGLYSLSHCSSHTFHSIEELICHFQKNSLVGNFPLVNTALHYPYREELARLEEELSCEDYVDELPDLDEADVSSPGNPVDPDLPLSEQPWYHGRLSRSEAEKVLAGQPEFSFLLRDSESVASGYSLSIRDTKSSCIHLRITYQDGGYVLGQYSHPFTTVSECIAFYCEEKLNIKGLAHRCLCTPVPQ